MKPPNLVAVLQALDSAGVEYKEEHVDEGWVVDVLGVLSGKQLEDVMKVCDTQMNVVMYTVPNVGLVIATEGAYAS